MFTTTTKTGKTFHEMAFEYLNGRTVTHDGIEGVLRYSKRNAIYPYAHTIHQLIHEPTEAAKETSAYQYIRRQLGDDWDTDLTDSECWCDWLGTDFQYEA
jgi:hypothetical protein